MFDKPVIRCYHTNYVAWIYARDHRHCLAADLPGLQTEDRGGSFCLRTMLEQDQKEHATLLPLLRKAPFTA